MTKNIGYLLPPGECYTEDLCCALVFYPDKDEYRRALLGAVGHFATWLTWERDSARRGVDAARAWKLANERTLECWQMACLDELINDMAAIRAILENRKDCCDDGITFGLQDDVETDIEPGVGDPPEFYGETAIADWDDWTEHVCYNAHLYVDNLKNMGLQLEGAVSQASLYIGLIAAGLVLLSFVGIGLPIAYLLAATVVSGLIYAATTETFATTEDDLEDARDLIVCALVNGEDLAAVVEDALSSDSAWDLFYQHIDYASATAIIHEGGAEGEFLPEETREDCGDCGEPGEYYLGVFFPTEIDLPWVVAGGAYWSAGYTGSARFVNFAQYLRASKAAINTAAATGGTYNLLLHRIDWTWHKTTETCDPKLRIITEPNYNYVWDEEDSAGTLYPKSVVFDPPLSLSNGGADLIQFMDFTNSCWGNVGEVEIWFDTDE